MTRDIKIMWIVLAALCVAPFMLNSPLFLMEVLCYALFACAFNLLLGYAGLLSFGHAAFFGSAGYIAGYVLINFKSWTGVALDPLLGILVGTAFSAVLGYLFGSLAIRRAGIYFSMITLGLAEIIAYLANQLPFTNGENGLVGIPRGTLFGLLDLSNEKAMYFFVLAIFAFGFWLVYRTVHSPFGQILKAIRENESRAISLGYNVQKFKLMAFVLSAALSGTAGATKSVVMGIQGLTDVHWHVSGDVILMTLLGGLGTIFGPAVGAAIISSLHHFSSALEGWVTVILGVTFIFCVLVFRRGVVGEISAFFKSRDKSESNA